MRLKHRVSLNGVHLDSLDNRILITGVDEAAGKESISAVSSAAGTGQRVTGMRRDTLDVTVKFALAIKPRDMTGRSELLEAINAWAAAGGDLKLNYRPNRLLKVICAQAPGAGDQFKWDNEFSITFRAYSIPYWQSDVIENTTAVGTSKSVQLAIPGSIQTVANAEVQNESGATITTVTVTAGSSSIALANLNLAGGQKLVIDHYWNAKNFYLRIRKGSGSSLSSVMNLRTADSADDLYCGPGAVTCTVTAQRAVSCRFYARGRFA